MITMEIPPEKILLGLPFYGRQFKTAMLFGPKSGGEGIIYKEIVRKRQEGWKRMWDDVCMVPYLVNEDKNVMIFYDDPVSIANKCTYARSKKLRGVMIWSIGSDFMDGRQPLLETIGKNWEKTTKKR